MGLSYRSAFFKAAVVLGALASVVIPTIASAATIQIPAITFVGRSGATSVGDATNGVLTNANGTFYAMLPFSTDGAVVKRLTIVYRDNDTDFNVTGKLFRRRINLGATNPFVGGLQQMASVTSAAASAGIQKTSTMTIKHATLDFANNFYYVEIVFPAATLELLGVEIEIQ